MLCIKNDKMFLMMGDLKTRYISDTVQYSTIHILIPSWNTPFFSTFFKKAFCHLCSVLKFEFLYTVWCLVFKSPHTDLYCRLPDYCTVCTAQYLKYIQYLEYIQYPVHFRTILVQYWCLFGKESFYFVLLVLCFQKLINIKSWLN